jgi:hypothetical protein
MHAGRSKDRHTENLVPIAGRPSLVLCAHLANGLQQKRGLPKFLGGIRSPLSPVITLPNRNVPIAGWLTLCFATLANEAMQKRGLPNFRKLDGRPCSKNRNESGRLAPSDILTGGNCIHRNSAVARGKGAGQTIYPSKRHNQPRLRKQHRCTVQLHQTPQLINKASHIYSERNSSSRSLIRP